MVREWVARSLAGLIVTIAGGVLAGASAGQEVKCAVQYSLEEQLILEWAALGGDPHAQFAMAQCALPDGEASYSEPEKVFAVKWLTLAACDIRGADFMEQRDRATRKLREQGDLSFRRFSGKTEDERWTKKEKRLQEYRDYKTVQLIERFERLGAVVDAPVRDQGRVALADDLARLGPAGLFRLSTLASCPDFNQSKTFAAAAWSVTADAWARHDLASAYGKSGREGWSIAGEAKERMNALTAPETRTARFEKARLAVADPARIAELEQKAALGDLQNLTFIKAVGATHESPLRASFEGPAVTMAAQYALESLGFIEFVNGPDNDYGPATIEAAGRAQARYGRPATRWLSHTDVRQMVCDAATNMDDPVSYYHLGVMFAHGWGFPMDLVRARYSIDRAQSLLDTRLSAAASLPKWKQEAYPAFRAQIAETKTAIDGAYVILPERDKGGKNGAVSADNLCR